MFPLLDFVKELIIFLQYLKLSVKESPYYETKTSNSKADLQNLLCKLVYKTSFLHWSSMVPGVC